jgi:hypothetical protein
MPGIPQGRKQLWRWPARLQPEDAGVAALVHFARGQISAARLAQSAHAWRLGEGPGGLIQPPMASAQ